jgi:hypothetical protein
VLKYFEKAPVCKFYFLTSRYGRCIVVPVVQSKVISIPSGMQKQKFGDVEKAHGIYVFYKKKSEHEMTNKAVDFATHPSP